MKIISLSSSSIRHFSVALLAILSIPAFANWHGGDKQPVPQWGLDAAKTPTPAYAKDAATVILFDEYVETVDAQGRAIERERKAIRILKPQGRGDAMCGVVYDVDEKINLLPRVDHRRRPKAIPGSGHRLCRCR